MGIGHPPAVDDRKTLSGPDGGDNVTWNNIPGGPGLFLDGNVEEEFSFVTGDITTGETLEFDVTEDVRSWAAGDTDNYGWGFIPTGNDGAGIVSFEDLDPMVRPRLILNPEIDFIPGDFDESGKLDLADIDLLMNAVATASGDLTFDLNNDATVDDADRDSWLASAGPANGLSGAYLLGDADLSGTVDAQDLNRLAISWQTDNHNYAANLAPNC